MTVHCGGCGYEPQWHKPVTGHCPGPEGGYLKTVTWQFPPLPDATPWREIMRRDYLARVAEYEAAHAPYVPPAPAPPPRVPARPVRAATEIAGYQGRQAVGLGRKAVAAGWAVEAHYWRAHDGVEGCAVRMQKGDLYAVATWARPAAQAGGRSGWAADIAYGVKRGEMPVKLTHTQLEGVIAG